MRPSLFLLVLCLASPAGADAAPFDANAAWDEFESTLRSYYGYLERDDFEVEAHLDRMEAAGRAAGDSEAFRRLLVRGLTAWTDPHLGVRPLAADEPNVWPTSSDLAIRCDPTCVIADVRADSPADAAGVRPGWELRAVDGVPIDLAVTGWFGDLLPAPTARQRSYAATLLANGRREGTRALELRVGKKRKRLELGNPRDFADTVADRPPIEAEVRDGVGVLRLNNQLGDRGTIPAIDAAVHRVKGARAVIIDLRNTPSGGNTDVARALIGHFVSEIRSYQVHAIPAVERQTTVPRRFIEQVVPRPPLFEGPVAVLGSRWTGSMGEGLVIGLHGAAGTRTFASNLGDLLGGLHIVSLEASGLSLELGAETLFHVDGTPRGDYVADVVIDPIERDADGGDPGLAAALEWVTTEATE